MPSDDAAIELQYLGLQRAQLAAKSNEARARHPWEPVIGCVGDDLKQLLDTLAPDGGALATVVHSGAVTGGKAEAPRLRIPALC